MHSRKQSFMHSNKHACKQGRSARELCEGSMDAVPQWRHENIKNHTGLGLSIAREIIGHMNGKIYLDKSTKTDYPGACFLIILPVKHS